MHPREPRKPACAPRWHPVGEPAALPLLARDRIHLGECDEAEGLVQQEVAGEDGGRISERRRARGTRSLRAGMLAELAGHVRDAAAFGVVVDHVVVNDESGVQQLERGGDGVQARRRIRIAAECAERGGDERGAEPLASARGPRHGVAQGAEARAQGARAGDDLVE